jgi:predicted PurR-regulated permease PerM
MAPDRSSPRKFSPKDEANRSLKPFPVKPPPNGPQNSAAEVAEVIGEEQEILHANLRLAAVGQVVVAIVAVIGLFYLAKVVLITTFSALLIAFVLEPIVDLLGKWRLPRPLGAMIAILLLLVVFGALTYFFYNRVVAFSNELPKYSAQIRSTVSKITSKTRKIEENTSKILQPQSSKQDQPVVVQTTQPPSIFRLMAGGMGVFGDLLLAVGFLPFLVYFMLSWQDHAHRATVRLFPKEHRLMAHRTIARISRMIRSFIVGNLVVGVVISLVSTIVFWRIGLSYPYFIGFISGFVSLLPYLGVVLAVLPPLAGGIGELNRTGAIIVVFTVLGSHVLALNVLYPKLVGRRLQLNPLAVTLAVLFWAWIWGAMGLILAVPIVGATKIICDHVDSLRAVGEWLGE